MVIYVYLDDGNTVCSNVKPDDREYLVVNEIPSGSGKLCTDLKTVWREPVVVEESKVHPSIELQIKALADRQDFLEDVIAEMATEVYK